MSSAPASTSQAFRNDPGGRPIGVLRPEALRAVAATRSGRIGLLTTLARQVEYAPVEVAA